MVEIMLCNDLHRDVTSATSSPDIGDVVSRWAHSSVWTQHFHVCGTKEFVK